MGFKCNTALFIIGDCIAKLPLSCANVEGDNEAEMKGDIRPHEIFFYLGFMVFNGEGCAIITYYAESLPQCK